MKVLATTDGSEFSMRALAELGRLLPAEGTTITLVSVFVSPVMFTYGMDPYNVSYERMTAQLREAAESDCAAGRDLLAPLGFPVATQTLMGDAAAAILEYAEQTKPDLLMVGSHGKSGFQRFLLGSVSAQILRHAPCSVLVVKLPQ
jgi:nucleotide-binding universal stress UspA family protein